MKDSAPSNLDGGVGRAVYVDVCAYVPKEVLSQDLSTETNVL